MLIKVSELGGNVWRAPCTSSFSPVFTSPGCSLSLLFTSAWTAHSTVLMWVSSSAENSVQKAVWWSVGERSRGAVEPWYEMWFVAEVTLLSSLICVYIRQWGVCWWYLKVWHYRLTHLRAGVPETAAGSSRWWTRWCWPPTVLWRTAGSGWWRAGCLHPPHPGWGWTAAPHWASEPPPLPADRRLSSMWESVPCGEQTPEFRVPSTGGK